MYPQLGESVGSTALEVVQPRPLGPDQDDEPAVDAGRDRKVPDEVESDRHMGFRQPSGLAQSRRTHDV